MKKWAALNLVLSMSLGYWLNMGLLNYILGKLDTGGDGEQIARLGLALVMLALVAFAFHLATGEKYSVSERVSAAVFVIAIAVFSTRDYISRGLGWLGVIGGVALAIYLLISFVPKPKSLSKSE